jgi:DNA primase-like protein
MALAAIETDRTEQVLEAAAELYERILWAPDAASAAREHLAGRGVDEQTLRAFGVGYAPGDWQESVEDLLRAGFADNELDAAGVATRSRRGRLQAQFRSRVMFPIRDADGRIAGFAGMATNPGPSWPQWLTSPERGSYSRGSALFGIEAAREAIESLGRAVILSDAVDVLLAHQRGDRATVAAIRSPLARDHLERLADVLGVPLEDVWVDRDHETEDGRSASLVVRGDARTAREHETLTRADVEPEKTNPALRSSEAAIAPDVKQELTTGGHAVLWVLRIALGLGIPLAWMAAMSPSSDDPASSPFVIGVGGVALTYVVLTAVASVISGRIRARSRARRMRGPWQRGATEWEPPAWTYHLFEEVLVGAAMISVFVCLVLFVTIGGFTTD